MTSFKAFQKFKPVRIIVIIWAVLAPITDMLIAVLLVYFLVCENHTRHMLLILMTISWGGVYHLFDSATTGRDSGRRIAC